MQVVEEVLRKTDHTIGGKVVEVIFCNCDLLIYHSILVVRLPASSVLEGTKAVLKLGACMSLNTGCIYFNRFRLHVFPASDQEGLSEGIANG